MDAAFMPGEIAGKLSVNHRVIIDFGPTIANLGKPIRNTIITLVVIKCSFDLVQTIINRWRTNTKGERHFIN